MSLRTFYGARQIGGKESTRSAARARRGQRQVAPNRARRFRSSSLGDKLHPCQSIASRLAIARGICARFPASGGRLVLFLADSALAERTRHFVWRVVWRIVWCVVRQMGAGLRGALRGLMLPDTGDTSADGTDPWPSRPTKPVAATTSSANSRGRSDKKGAAVLPRFFCPYSVLARGKKTWGKGRAQRFFRPGSWSFGIMLTLP